MLAHYTLTIEQPLIEQANHYAKAHNVSITVMSPTEFLQTTNLKTTNYN